jgi:hypothetical protein
VHQIDGSHYVHMEHPAHVIQAIQGILQNSAEKESDSNGW